MAYACVEEGEFKLAQLCGLNIIVNADDLMEVRRCRRKPTTLGTAVPMPPSTLLLPLARPTLPCPSTACTSPPLAHQVSEFYQSRGHYEELISLLESGIGALHR